MGWKKKDAATRPHPSQERVPERTLDRISSMSDEALASWATRLLHDAGSGLTNKEIALFSSSAELLFFVAMEMESRQ